MRLRYDCIVAMRKELSKLPAAAIYLSGSADHGLDPIWTSVCSAVPRSMTV